MLRSVVLPLIIDGDMANNENGGYRDSHHTIVGDLSIAAIPGAGIPRC
jgi:hypothetical protein